MIVLEISKPGCKIREFDFSFTVANAWTHVIFVVMMFYCFFLCVIDVVLFTKQNGCSLKRYFFDDDPFKFRIEFYMVFLMIIIGFLFTLIPPVLLISTKLAGGATPSQLRNIGGLFFFILECLQLSIPYYGVIIALIRIIQQKMIKKVERTEFEELFNDEVGNELLKEFAINEWSIENIYLHDDILKYKKTPKKLMKSKCEEILKTYIEEGSPLEVNISRRIRKLTIQKIRNFDNENSMEIFDGVGFEVLMNLQDTFGRFKFTQLYVSWKKKFMKKKRMTLSRITSPISLDTSRKVSMDPSIQIEIKIEETIKEDCVDFEEVQNKSESIIE
jgi:hypothetical protein